MSLFLAHPKRHMCGVFADFQIKSSFSILISCQTDITQLNEYNITIRYSIYLNNKTHY